MSAISHKKSYAVITGGASGIGLAFAEATLRRKRGDTPEYDGVALLDVRQDAVEEAAKKLSNTFPLAKIVPAVCDVADEESVITAAEKVFGEFNDGRVALLLANAGVFGQHCEGIYKNVKAVKSVIEVNLFGTYHTFGAFVGKMVEACIEDKANGVDRMYHVLATSSVAGQMPGTSTYAVTKHAIQAACEALHFEIKANPAQIADRFKTHCLSPCLVSTKLTVNTDAVQAQRNFEATAESKADAKMLDDITAAGGTPPSQCADAMWHGLDNDYFYIYSHPHVSKQLVKDRTKGQLSQKEPILSDFGWLVKANKLVVGDGPEAFPPQKA